MASSVGVFDLGTEVLSGPGDSWVLGKIDSSQHNECGIPTLANREKLENSSPGFLVSVWVFFSFSLFLPCGSRIHGLKSHPGLNLLCPWGCIADLSFSILT